ncbi:MAG: hypothetical protein A3K19_30175 [Lentisphaerae bacterium RIFOXYB12_FULL_65_16]|nr:MAG: hypothetical protein A3K18_29540 [Lentisphaerae bacterium RIFOXYA12_64_32]OGV85841.1 MAG: hypothetical protein A3K19_30175 [Lentisphaerae bacterium RIFOXYB12_FULL_65_16]
MKAFALFTVFLLVGFCAVAADAPADGSAVALIRLNDKSQIVGRIVGLKEGVYEIKTESLGLVNVPEGKVASIVYESSAVVSETERAAPAPAVAAGEEDPWDIDVDQVGAGLGGAGLDFQSLLKSIAGNPALMSKVEGLRKDAALQAVVNDPAIMKAMQSGDLATLLNNDKIKALLQNPAVQSVTQDVLEGQPTPGAPAAKAEETDAAEPAAADDK